MGTIWHQRRAIGLCLALQGVLTLACVGLIGTDARSAQPLLRAESFPEPLHLFGGSDAHP
ncbi:hypothetical protein SynMINOS11_02418 [Synechococcus sp. Minos11]|jgi:hypothetical protein|uniref:hypothetical protein n=1 Tax=Synechococcus sp. Minos11 TaxID=221341 RepID=UPI001646403C|nr:hypothetical protein [Synechococcus sp. Minos11]QNJ09862.1 hypothetical protein SynMINOS11_02418 [Synechococcus sp. Minos11]